MKVAILGLGKMGAAMTERLCSVGREVIVWNRTSASALRTAEKCVSKIKGRVLVAATPRHALKALSFTGGVAIIVVSNTQAVKSILEGLQVPENVTITNLTSGSPSEGRQVLDMLPPGTRYVDGAYCGAPAAAAAGSGQVFVSGTHIDDARDVLECLGDVTVAGTTVGASRALDYAVVDLAFVNLLSMCASAPMLDKENVSLDVFLAEAKKRLAVVPSSLDIAATKMQAKDYADPVATLATWRNFWASRLPYVKEAGLPDPSLANFAVSLLDKAGASNPDLKTSDVSRIQEVLRFGRENAP